MCRKSPIPLETRVRNTYVPYDSLYSLCSEPVHVFLPPSRHSFGIIAPSLPDELPLEFSPCEYFGLVQDGGAFTYARPGNGYKDFYDWQFDSDGSGVMHVHQAGIDLRCRVQPAGERALAVTYDICNESEQGVAGMYVNPCLRYQNITGMRGRHHENVFVRTDDGIDSIFDLLGKRTDATRVLALHQKTTAEMDRLPALQPLCDSLMASRHMNLVDAPCITGSSIAAERLDENFALCFYLEGRVFGYFSRSEGEKSGCMHVIPLLTELAPGESRCIAGRVCWESISARELMGKLGCQGS